MITTKLKRAEDIMTHKLVTVRPDMRVFEAVKILLDRRISGAPVVEDGKLVGMLSEKDCIQALMRAVHDRLPPSLVGDVMSRELLTVDPQTSLLTVAHIFMTNPVRRLPVVDERGRLVGQISRRDLLAAAVDIFEGASTRDAAVLYLSAVQESAPESVTERRRRR